MLLNTLFFSFFAGGIFYFQAEGLSKTYNWKSVDQLEKILDAKKVNGNASDIPSLLEALERHIELARSVRLVADARDNLQAGLEFYGEVIWMLERTVMQFFERFGTRSMRGNGLYQRALEDIVTREGSPLVKGGFIDRYRSDGTMLYVILPSDTALQEVNAAMSLIQATSGLRLTWINEQIVEDLVPQQGVIRVLNIKGIYISEPYYWVPYDFKVKARHGVGSLGDKSGGLLYRRTGNEFFTLNLIP